VTSNKDILIVGAGIAGLTAALTLARRGVEVTIADAFEAPSEIGAGIQVAPNASHILRSLGVLDSLAQKAIAPSSIRLGDAHSGTILLDMPVSGPWLDSMGAPYLTAHRAVLHGALYNAVTSHPAVDVLTGHRLQEVKSANGRATALFDTRGGSVEIETKMLIGADGIWSKVREAVPGASPAMSTGRIAWRAIAPAQREREKQTVTAWMAPDFHMVCYPVRNAETVNIAAITRGDAREGEWEQTGGSATLTRLLENAEQTVLPGAIPAESWTKWPLSAVDPRGRWHSDGILLIGDAAHGMEPFAAQGAAMAIEDGYAAGNAIAEYTSDPDAAFRLYDITRRDRVKRVAARTSFNRWVYHQSGPGRYARNAYLRARSAETFLKDLEWLYGYRTA
jgi:salicylate hydroxylase